MCSFLSKTPGSHLCYSINLLPSFEPLTSVKISPTPESPAQQTGAIQEEERAGAEAERGHDGEWSLIKDDMEGEVG